MPSMWAFWFAYLASYLPLTKHMPPSYIYCRPHSVYRTDLYHLHQVPITQDCFSCQLKNLPHPHIVFSHPPSLSSLPCHQAVDYPSSIVGFCKPVAHSIDWTLLNSPWINNSPSPSKNDDHSTTVIYDTYSAIIIALCTSCWWNTMRNNGIRKWLYQRGVLISSVLSCSCLLCLSSLLPTLSPCLFSLLPTAQCILHTLERETQHSLIEGQLVQK